MQKKIDKNPATLLDLKSNIKAKVLETSGGAVFTKRLNDIGVYQGCEIIKRTSKNRYPIIVEVCGVTVALGKGMAAKIFVK